MPTMEEIYGGATATGSFIHASAAAAPGAPTMTAVLHHPHAHAVHPTHTAVIHSHIGTHPHARSHPMGHAAVSHLPPQLIGNARDPDVCAGCNATGVPLLTCDDFENKTNERSRFCPNCMIGKKVRVFWPVNSKWYMGTVERYNITTGEHLLRYDDDDTEWVRIGEDNTTAPPEEAAALAGAAMVAPSPGQPSMSTSAADAEMAMQSTSQTPTPRHSPVQGHALSAQDIANRREQASPVSPSSQAMPPRESPTMMSAQQHIPTHAYIHEQSAVTPDGKYISVQSGPSLASSAHSHNPYPHFNGPGGPMYASHAPYHTPQQTPSYYHRNGPTSSHGSQRYPYPPSSGPYGPGHDAHTKSSINSGPSPSPPNGKRKNGPKAWTKEEDSLLLSIVQNMRMPMKWSVVAQNLPGRTGKQCRERYVNHLNPRLKVTDWSPIEDATIFHLYNTIGSHWAKMSKMIPGRTDNGIKNRFHNLRRQLEREDEHRLRLSTAKDFPDEIRMERLRTFPEELKGKTADLWDINSGIGVLAGQSVLAGSLTRSAGRFGPFRLAGVGEMCVRCGFLIPSVHTGSEICTKTGWCQTCVRIPPHVSSTLLRECLNLRRCQESDKRRIIESWEDPYLNRKEGKEVGTKA